MCIHSTYKCIHVHNYTVYIHCTVCVYLCVSVCRRSSKRVKDLWWLGLPPGVRGQIWKMAIGNDLNISPGECVSVSVSVSVRVRV